MTRPLLIAMTAWFAVVLGTFPAVAQTVSGPSPIVIGQSFKMTSTILGQAREINVWTPPGYGDSGKTYPVLYLLDGGQDQDFHHISGLVQLGTIVGTTRDVILVGIATKDRRNELAFRAEHDPSLVADYPTHGQSERFRRFLAQEVMPFVEGRYRTNGENAVMGESLAGLFVVETFLKQPTLFDAYIAVSPSLWWDQSELVTQAPALLSANAPTGTLWMTMGNEGGEMQTAMDRLNTTLAQAKTGTGGFVVTYSARPDQSHATIFHEAALDALRQIYAPEPAQP